MLKKEWARPLTIVQKFVANEYVAACGDENKVYKFTCDAPSGKLYYYPRSDGTIDGVYEGRGRAELLGNYYPCGASHDAKVTSDFYDGFVDYNENKRQDEGEGVIVWRGTYNNDGHATTNLDMNSWVTEKS